MTMSKKRPKFSDQLRQAIERSDKTRYRISQETGVSEAVLSRFMNRKVGLSMETVDLICECLRLRLVAEDIPLTRKGR
jgi:transcriptional regulator with XRE-family HTH domain